MVANTNKRLKVSNKSDNTDEIKKLKEIQDKLKKINEEETNKVFEIKHKYNEVSKPLNDKRNNLIKSIPNFWLTVFSLHPSLHIFLNVEDHEIFKHLSSLDVEYQKGVSWSYSITFNFNPNPYFEDTKIVKYVTILGEKRTKVTNTPIRWKEGKGNLNENSPTDISFFNWFSEPEQNGLMNRNHDKIADAIKDDLWPNALDYFNNEDSDEADEDDDEDVSSEVEEDDDDSSYDVKKDSDDSDDDDDDSSYDVEKDSYGSDDDDDDSSSDSDDDDSSDDSDDDDSSDDQEYDDDEEE